MAEPTLRDRLRDRRAQIEREDHHDFDIPRYAGGLVGRYRRLLYKELKPLLDAQRGGERTAEEEVADNADFLIRACVELLGRESDGTLVHLGDHEQPVRYDEGLDEALQIDAPTARDAVLAVFGGIEVQMMRHASEVFDWMIGADADTYRRLLGEA